jgi:DNA-binding IclR family transcriptional regulator
MARTSSRSTRSAPRRVYSAPALEKGMDIIELLADVDTGLTVSDIAQQLGRRMSELFRIIMVMERRAWLHKDTATSRYSVAYHLLKLAHRGTHARTLSAAAAPVMHELSTKVNQSCHLVVRSGAQGLVVLRQENQRRHANLSVRLGATIDLATSCSGQVLLAHLPAGECAEALRSAPRPGRSTRAKRERALERIRQRGFEVLKSPVTAGVTDISYPIHGFDGTVVAALTIPYLHACDDSLPATVEQTRKFLEAAAARISRTLGWVG